MNAERSRGMPIPWYRFSEIRSHFLVGFSAVAKIRSIGGKSWKGEENRLVQRFDRSAHRADDLACHAEPHGSRSTFELGRLRNATDTPGKVRSGAAIRVDQPNEQLPFVLDLIFFVPCADGLNEVPSECEGLNHHTFDESRLTCESRNALLEFPRHLDPSTNELLSHEPVYPLEQSAQIVLSAVARPAGAESTKAVDQFRGPIDLSRYQPELLAEKGLFLFRETGAIQS
jgi:hypothetical protein